MNTVPPTGPWTETTHLISLAELEDAFATDKVLTEYREKIEHHDRLIADREKQAEETRAEIELLLTAEAELRAKMKELDRQKREARGKLSLNQYQISLNVTRKKQVLHRVTLRRKKVWQLQVDKRLAEIGRGISWNNGRKGGGGFEIRDADTINKR